MPDTRDLILTTAFRHFFKRGYKDVTMNELVEATGLSKGAFYHYFSSKEELYELTMEKHLMSYMKNFRIEYDDSLTLRENIKKLFGRFVFMIEEIKDILTEDPLGITNYLFFLQEAMKKEEFRTRLTQYNNSFNQEFSHWIRFAKHKKEIPEDVDEELLARHLTYLMKGMTINYSMSLIKDPFSETFNRIIDQLFDLLNPKL